MRKNTAKALKEALIRAGSSLPIPECRVLANELGMNLVEYLIAFYTHEIRVAFTEEGRVHFVAKDICDALEITDVEKALDGVNPQDKCLLEIETPCGNIPMWCVNEDKGIDDLMAPSGTTFSDHIWMTVLPSADRFHGVKRGTSTRVEPLTAVFLKLNRTAALPRIPKAKEEKRIEQAFGAMLERQGQKVRYQVSCEMGIADIVTSTAIYEVKAVLSRSHVRQAIAQVLAYKTCINSTAKVYVVGCRCRKSSAPTDFKFAEILGVEVIVWEDEGPDENAKP